MKAPPILFDEGWSFMQTGIRQLMTILEGEPERQFNYEQYMIYYTTIYNMCFQMHPNDYSQQLYDKYKETFVEYINLMVLPSLREKHDEFMLRELVKCWSNHKVMLRWLRWIFQYLDRYFIPKRSLPSLREVGLTCFRDSVYEETKGRAKDAVIVLINQEREGGQIDRELLKNVVGIYVEIGMGKMDYYEKDFEAFMLADSAKYYARKVSNWIKKDSCPDYMLKTDDCLNKENHIVDHYLHSSSRPKLIEKVKNNFLVYISRLLKKEHWCCTLLRDDKVNEETKGRAKGAMLALINQEREGEKIDRKLLHVLGISFKIFGMGQMDCYKDFEVFMLADSADYYARKASNWIKEDSCPDYMLKAEDCLNKENHIVGRYLHSSSWPKLIEKVQNELLVNYSSQLLEKEQSGCRTLLHDDKVDDLTRMYKLFSKIPKGLDPVANMFKQHVTAEGMTLVQQADDAASNKSENVGGPQEQVFFRKVIDLHDKFMAYVTDCFSNHNLFHKALKEAFEVFCNETVAGCSSAELLSAYCDNILKKGGSEKLSDEAIEETLDKVVKLLAYINDKVLFVEFYRKKLSRRLLFYKSANDDHERLILSKLKQHCGGHFTSKMEGMVTDLALAKENHSQFNEYLSNNTVATPGIDLTVTVLTTCFWPSYKSSDLCLPVEMVKCVEVFKEFYQTKTKNRKLTWIYSLGTCNVNGLFDQKTIELILGTYQAAALLLFNASEKLSYTEIKTQLNLADDDVVRLLQSLSCAKHKILTKVPSSRTVSETDVFQFNSKFTDRMRRIRIPLAPVDERKMVVENVDKDRRYAIDASIVRIMKSRKVLDYQQLVSECMEQLGRMFKPDVKVIKKRIEDLITREYLERDKENRQQFRYLT